MPRYGLFEAAASVEVVNDGEDGNRPNGEWVGGVGGFGEGGDRCVVAGGWPRCVSSFNGVVQVGEVVKPLKREAFKFDETPAVGAGAGFVLFGGECSDEVIGSNWFIWA